MKDREAPRWLKAFVVAAAVVISAATTFVKQHSAVDVFAALPVCVLAEAIVFRDYWGEKLRRKK